MDIEGGGRLKASNDDARAHLEGKSMKGGMNSSKLCDERLVPISRQFVALDNRGRCRQWSTMVKRSFF
ncbi:hypothetical protein Naga_101390g2 [Nannochloropsis gaditana]|uniref:Uncharacterized protein n=1 Tax=Nannochloropsis gaditana TaxID=72520 RepID=W7THZ7_9STRA|nr:hypothetical protein Naga_101390g2 [Nannochloropsis gaditana]